MTTYNISLFCLGGEILIRCKYESCAKKITNFFSALCCNSCRTPDIIIDCDWEDLSEYFFRSRPNNQQPELEGIRIYTSGNSKGLPWKYYEPPFPPFMLEPFKNRFIGLHAGAVVSPDKECLLLIGDRGCGKTSLTMELVNKFGYMLLTDETVFLHRRTNLVEPYPRAIKLRTSNNDSVVLNTSKSCNLISSRPFIATHAIFLINNEYSEKTKKLFYISKSSETFQLLMRNHIYVGSPYSEGLITFAYLSNNLKSAIWFHDGYDDLMDSIHHSIDFVSNRKDV